jgi:hypothetical protein
MENSLYRSKSYFPGQILAKFRQKVKRRHAYMTKCRNYTQVFDVFFSSNFGITIKKLHWYLFQVRR